MLKDFGIFDHFLRERKIHNDRSNLVEDIVTGNVGERIELPVCEPYCCFKPLTLLNFA